MAKKLWGGRFSKKTDPRVEEFTRSIQFDYKLVECDIHGSWLHVEILKDFGYLTDPEARKLQDGLDAILAGINSKTTNIDYKCEDIHTFIQNQLQKEVGDLALKLHTARSRNDQVVFATKLYCKKEIEMVKANISKLNISFESLITEYKDTTIPGFTHMQHAQPVYLKDYLGLYVAMLNRDITRLSYISDNVTITMGAGALAGTPILAEKYKIAASKVIKKFGLGKDPGIEVTSNSLDSVSDRDFVIEIIDALAILSMHLSRLAEDLIIWSTKEFDFVEIDEAFCTGSSLMPQKKNPDVLELVRGNAGRIYGNLVSVLTMMKGLPLTYNRDMQLDKEPLFNSFEIVKSELNVLTGLIKTLKFNKPVIEKQLEDEALYATDLVYFLVKKKIAFKEAHDIVGKLVNQALNSNGSLKKIFADYLTKKCKIKSLKKQERQEIEDLFKPLKSVQAKKSIKR